MGKPAARLSDFHICPMVTGLVPHVGGPCISTVSVFVVSLPSVRVGDTAICNGPPDTVITGSSTVFIEGKPAARMGDTTAHGGTIVAGSPTVLIGD